MKTSEKFTYVVHKIKDNGVCVTIVTHTPHTIVSLGTDKEDVVEEDMENGWCDRTGC